MFFHVFCEGLWVLNVGVSSSAVPNVWDFAQYFAKVSSRRPLVLLNCSAYSPYRSKIGDGGT